MLPQKMTAPQTRTKQNRAHSPWQHPLLSDDARWDWLNRSAGRQQTPNLLTTSSPQIFARSSDEPADPLDGSQSRFIRDSATAARCTRESFVMNPARNLRGSLMSQS